MTIKWFHRKSSFVGNTRLISWSLALELGGRCEMSYIKMFSDCKSSSQWLSCLGLYFSNEYTGMPLYSNLTKSGCYSLQAICLQHNTKQACTQACRTGRGWSTWQSRSRHMISKHFFMLWNNLKVFTLIAHPTKEIWSSCACRISRDKAGIQLLHLDRWRET